MAEKAILSYFYYVRYIRSKTRSFSRKTSGLPLIRHINTRGDENVRVGFGMDPDEKLNKANCLQPAK
jgi:hypothetical protein